MRLDSGTLILLLIGTIMRTGLAAAPEQSIRVTEIVREPGNVLTLKHTTVAGFYYVLLRGEEVTGMFQPLDMAIGASEVGALFDANPLAAHAFYRIQQVPLNQPLDTDSDGIDDLFELSHPGFLNPFYRRDAEQDFDGDGRSNLQEYIGGTDLTQATAQPPSAPILNPVATPTRQSSVLLTGSAQPNSSVKVEGGASPATGTAAANGQFQINVPLRQNAISRLSVVAFDSQGQASPPNATDVLHDAQRPSLLIDYPGEGAELIVDSTVVLGRVGDALSGFIGLTVSISNLTENVGGPANVAVGLGPNGTFERGGVPLAGGTNVLSITARDSLGNSVNRQITVRRIAPTGARLVTISGDMQSASIQQRVPEPLAVMILEADDSPFTNKLVTFEVTRSDGRLLPVNTNALAADFTTRPEANANGAALLQLFTDSQGMAEVRWTLGSDSGCANNRVTVSSRDIAGPVLFCASASPGPPLKVNIGTGNNQRAETGGSAPEPLRVWVNDTCNGVAGIPVTFRVLEGGGKVNGRDSVTIPTIASGHAEVNLILGTNAGNNRIEATFPNNPNAPAVFVISGVKRNLDQPTTFTGIVLDNANQPILGAACHLEIGTFSTETVLSDTNGQFRFSKLPSGTAHLFVDGRTALFVGTNSIPSNSFPALMFMATIVPNAENSLPLPVLLPRLNPNNTRVYRGTNDLALTTEGIAGLRMIIKANSMRHADGRPVTPQDPATVSLNQVHHDDMPMPLADGAGPPFAWSLQPGGATFDPPVQIEYPNMSSLPPGAIAYFLSFSHELERFEIVGSGHVDATGAIIVSDPGSGLSHAGWGASCPSYPATGNCGSGIGNISGPATVEVAEEITLLAPDPPVSWSVNSMGGEVSIVFQTSTEIKLKGEVIGKVSVVAQGSSRAEKHVWVEACDVDQTITQLPSSLQGGDWTIGSIETSGDDGLVVENVALRGRYMARRMSVPYLLVQLTPMSQPLRLELVEDSGDSQPRIRLIKTASHGDGNLATVLATYLIDRLPDENSSATLCVTMTYSFFRHDPLVDCNSLNTPCAKYYPLVSYTFKPGVDDQGIPINLVKVTVPQRFEFEPDGTSLTRCGLASDHPQIAPPSTITFYPIGQNPAAHEYRSVVFRGYGTPDNYHQTKEDHIDTPVPLPGTFLDHAGCPECVHIHWRWSAMTQGQNPNFFANNGQPMIPPGSPQSVIVGHTLYRSSEVDPQNTWHSAVGFETYNAYSPGTGAKIVFWYEGSSTAETDVFFQHGGFFLPPAPPSPSPSVDSAAAPSSVRGIDPSLSLASPILGLAPYRLPILDDSWMLSVAGQTVRPDPNGGFTIPNVSAPDATDGTPPDGISDDLVRVIGVSRRQGVNRYLTSEFFQVLTGTNVTLTNIQFHVTAPRSPESLSATADRVTFNALGQQAQLTVMGHYADGTQSNLTARAKGTTYRTSNARIASVDIIGRVTAIARGMVFITAINEGATTVLQLDVVPGDPLTTVIGFVYDTNGLPVAGAEVSLTGLAAQAITGADGRFVITGVPTTLPAISATAQFFENGERLIAVVSGIPLVPGGITDIGLLTVRPPTVRIAPPKIAASLNSTWVIEDHGSMWAWGLNFGRLGDGTQVQDRVSPVRIGQDDDWLAVSAKVNHTLALKEDGSLWSWGANGRGQLGIGAAGNQASPVRVGPDSDWMAIAAGDNYSLAIKADGSLWVWGDNRDSQLGDGTSVSTNVPIRIGTDLDWVAIAANDGSAALKRDGSLWGWGGENSALPSTNRPARIGADTDWAALALGQNHLILLKLDGTLWAVGDVTFAGSPGGVFGGGGSEAPVQLGADTDWIAITAGRDTTFALKENGSLWAFGDNQFGKLGDGTIENRLSFVRIGPAQEWAAVGTGHDHAVALTTNGQFYSWGDNDAGKLGLGYKGNTQPDPLQAGPDSDWTLSTFGGSFAVALKADHTLWTWGQNFDGQLGDGTTVSRSAPVRIGGDSNWVFATPGQSHALAIRQDGSLWAWGQNLFGQLARDPAQTFQQLAPVQIGVDHDWVSAAAGAEHSFAIKTDGSLWAWGGNSSGQLGDGTTQMRLAPTRIGTDNDWQSVIASVFSTYQNSFALKTGGTLWAWGANQFLQFIGSDLLGIGGTNNQLTATMVGTNNYWAAVAAQPFPGNFRFAINTNRELWTWAGFPDFGTFFSPVTTEIDFVDFDEFGQSFFSAALASAEITEINSLLVQLTNHTDLLSDFLWNQMPFHQESLIDTNIPANQKSATLSDGLNISLKGPSIYEEQRFAGITLSAEINALLQANPQGQELIRLNRLLLEAAYPAEIAPLSNRAWTQISAGQAHWLGIRNDGSLWGEGPGQPRRQIDSALNWSHAAAGNEVSAAIRADGTLWTWGDYSNGLLGNPALFVPRPVAIP